MKTKILLTLLMAPLAINAKLQFDDLLKSPPKIMLKNNTEYNIIILTPGVKADIRPGNSVLRPNDKWGWSLAQLGLSSKPISIKIALTEGTEQRATLTWIIDPWIANQTN